jgi:predicted ATPase
MKIKALTVADHTIFGSKVIHLFGNTESFDNKTMAESDSRISIDISDKADGNHYTFIIGENGVGKSAFIKTIVHYINYNYRYQDNIFVRWRNFYTDTERYTSMDRFSKADTALHEYGILKKHNDTPIQNFHSVLAPFNAQVVLIGNHIELPIVDKNPDYRNFNYNSKINNTKSLFLRALIQFKDSENLRRLNLLLGKDDLQWKYKFGLATDYAIPPSQENEYSQVKLKREENFDIYRFVELIDKIEFTSSDTLAGENLNPEEVFLFRQLYENGAFFKLYYDSYGLFGSRDFSIKTFFRNLKNAHVFKKIREFIKIGVTVLNKQQLLVQASQQVMDTWQSLVSERDELNTFDALLINLLESLKLIRLDITCNDISIDRMSSGEQTMIRLFSYFSDMPHPESKENIIVFVDEPENSLHPKWQHDYLDRFRQIVEEVYGFSNSHFIFATHSPLIIMKAGTSSVKSNVVSFYKDEYGRFQSEEVTDIPAYSFEAILLDEFRVSYRDYTKQQLILDLLQRRYTEDPMDAIPEYHKTKAQIDALFIEIK